MLTPDVTSEASSLWRRRWHRGSALFATVYDVSGVHFNPAVTFGMTVCGHIGVPTAILYCVSLMVAAALACLLLLRVGSAGQAIPATRIVPEMTGFGGAILESVITFALVYVASDPRFSSSSSKGGQSGSVVGPLAVGLVAGACVLAAGALTGASMNPARSFGPAVVSGFKNHGAHWIGPLIGAALAALVHEHLM